MSENGPTILQRLSLSFIRRQTFSLRALILLVGILAIPLGWIGWGMHCTRKRAAFGNMHGTVFYVGFPDKMPWVLRICGAQPMARVLVSKQYFTVDDMQWIRELFPEADEVLLISGEDPIWDEERFMEEREERADGG
jgi:hypothetical protein